jgi:hypothetical protein
VDLLDFDIDIDDFQPSLHSLLGNNGRADSERSRALGWTPVKTTEDFLAAVLDEVEHWEI